MRTVVRDLVLLLLMCLALYCTGLDTHGVTNWQEAQRVVVARDMQQRFRAGEDGALVVPRHNGLAYVAKPPMIYWATLAVAGARGGEVELFDLRLVVALAGTLGVLATYLAAREILRPLGVRGPGAHEAGARWAGVFLATGVLYVRSSRIGELDILLAPLVVGAIGCIWRAYRAHLERPVGAGPDWFGLRARWGWVLLAGACASAATLTKGPPALMVIALGAYGGIFWRAAGADRAGGGLGALLGAAACGGVALARMDGAGDLLGVALLAGIGGLLGMGVQRLGRRDAARDAWLGLAATHPVVVLGAPVAFFWWWGREISSRIGVEQAMFLAKEQAENDLNIFMPASAVRNLEALAYGCGVGSIVMLVALAWWVKFHPRVRRRAAGVIIAVAWVVLSYAALSMFGKGVARYLTPVWPGVAMVAGAWLARRREPGEDVTRVAPWRAGPFFLGSACAVLGVTQAWWYASGREAFEAERTPRAMMESLKAREPVRRYASFEFYTPALDYYAGSYVQPLVTAQMGESIAGSRAWTLEELAADVRAHGAQLVFVREWSLDRSQGTPVERLRAAGLRAAPVDDLPEFIIDHGRARVGVVRIE